jgi:hypothetical protein
MSISSMKLSQGPRASAPKRESFYPTSCSIRTEHGSSDSPLCAAFPAVYYAREYVEAGGLASYASSFVAQFQRAAALVDKVLKGTKPGDLPVKDVGDVQLAVATANKT